MTDYKGILICGEISGRSLSSTSKELMKAGRNLADGLKEPLSTLLIGTDVETWAQEAVFLGSDTVYIIEGTSFSQSVPGLYAHILTDVCGRTNPSIILLGHTDMGRDVAPRLAAKLKASVCLDCTQLSIEPATKARLQTKPVYGGNAIAVWASEARYQCVVTMRPRASEPAAPDTSREGEIVPVKSAVDGTAIKERLTESVEEKVQGIKLEDAKVIVAGGGGIGGAEGFQMLEDLANALQGTVGISRVPKDEGWMPGHLEIGQTGHVVQPDLYIAVGISGAPQHLAGCSGAKTIVAINRDADAHIFEEADYGIVGDYRDVLPSLTERLKELKS